LLLAGTGCAAELLVGPGQRFATPSAAAQVAEDGDTISIAAGEYRGDVCCWRQNRLHLRGVGGRAHLAANGRAAEGKAIWVLAGADTVVEQIEFSGATVADKNGAGIRLEGAGLTVRHCSFHDNQDGILTGAGATSDVVIEQCEFDHNGAGDGYSHNLYIGRIRSLVFRGNVSRRAVVGHNLKSRAERNWIEANRFLDGPDGTASYAVDVPNGGLSYLVGNQMQKGPHSSNHAAMISYGSEGPVNPIQRLYVAYNTLVNDQSAATTFVSLGASTSLAVVANTLAVGPGSLVTGAAARLQGNYLTTDDPFMARREGDYRVRQDSPVRGIASIPVVAEDQPLWPAWQYDHVLGLVARPTRTSGILIGSVDDAVINP
jgi:hypothetical protein